MLGYLLINQQTAGTLSEVTYDKNEITITVRGNRTMMLSLLEVLMASKMNLVDMVLLIQGESYADPEKYKVYKTRDVCIIPLMDELVLDKNWLIMKLRVNVTK